LKVLRTEGFVLLAEDNVIISKMEHSPQLFENALRTVYIVGNIQRLTFPAVDTSRRVQLRE
jgi:hypothetical protein